MFSNQDRVPEAAPVGKPEGRQKVVVYDPSVDFAKLRQTFRLGPELVDFLQEMFPEPFRSSLSAGKTNSQVKLVS